MCIGREVGEKLVDHVDTAAFLNSFSELERSTVEKRVDIRGHVGLAQ